MSRAELARHAGLDDSHIARIEDGAVHASLDAYARLATALGADLSARPYPNTGPAIRDRHQARILEALLTLLHPRWRPFPEAAVRQPSRGWIDLVLHEPAAQLVVATEIQSSLPRLEQLLRWSCEKAASLPSWDRYAQLGAVRATSQLLIVRSTRATRDVGRQFAHQLEAAYPAHPADALVSLRTADRPWPGAAVIWVHVDAEAVRFSERRAVGRAGVGQSAP